MPTIINNRFIIIYYFILQFIGIAMFIRTVLLFKSFDQLDIGLLQILQIYLIGFVYDFITGFYFVIPFILYVALIPNKIFVHKWHKYFLTISYLFLIYILVFNVFSEYLFWDEFGKRFNFIAVDYLVYTHEVINNIIESYPLIQILSLIFLISAGITYFTYQNIITNSTPFISFKRRIIIGISLLLLPVIFFNLFDKQPLANISQNQFNNELAKNGIYSFFSAFRNNTLDYEEFYKTIPLETVMPNLKKNHGFDGDSVKVIQKSGEELKYNIMLVMIESLSAEYVGAFGDDRGLTPNLDKLSTQSLFFNNLYATGTRTVRGMEAVVLSVPPTPGRSIVKRPDNHNMFSAGFVFKDKGYENKFIYAGHGYFDNMNSFFSHNGFDTVDRTDMSSDEITFANVWGVCDEDLFARTLKEADKSYKKQQPFFNFIMTTSNHRPYTYPEHKIDIPSHTGRSGGVKYTDYAINEFLKQAAVKSWFKNTIFVIVADHNGGSAGKTSLPNWRYKIPLFIYAPNIITPSIISKLSSQIDIMPTLFSILNFNYDSKFYGTDILAENFSERALIGNYQKLGLLKNNKLVILEPDKTVSEYEIVEQTLYDVKYQKIKYLDKDVEDAVTFYQTASYLYKHKLNRWHSSYNKIP